MLCKADISRGPVYSQQSSESRPWEEQVCITSRTTLTILMIIAFVRAICVCALGNRTLRLCKTKIGQIARESNQRCPGELKAEESQRKPYFSNYNRSVGCNLAN